MNDRLSARKLANGGQRARDQGIVNESLKRDLRPLDGMCSIFDGSETACMQSLCVMRLIAGCLMGRSTEAQNSGFQTVGRG